MRLKRQSRKLKAKGFDAERAAAQAALDDLKKAQEDNNLDEMKAKLEALNEKAQGLAVKLYGTSRSSATSSSRSRRRTSNRNAGDDVVDGEFTEK